MRALLRFPLRYLLLILIGGAALILVVLSYFASRPPLLNLMEQQAEARMSAHLTELQGVLELLLRLGQTDGARRVVASFGADPGLESMLLIDSDSHIIASTSLAEVGQPVTATAHDLDRAPLERIARSGGIAVASAPDGMHLFGYARVCAGADGHILRARTCGALYLRQSLAAERRAALGALQRQMLVNAGGIVVGAGFLWWLLQRLLTRRAGHLIDRAQAFVAGDRTARARLEGRDELAQIGESLDQLLDTVVRNERQQRRTQRALSIRNRAIEASTNGVLICDATEPDHPIVYANPAFERMTGFTTAEVIGRNCRFLQRDDRDQPAITAMRAALAAPKPVNVVLRNYRKDGQLIWNELSIGPVVNELNELTHFVGIQNDITARKEVEQELRRLSKVFMEATDPIIIEDLQGRIIDLNAEAERAYGWTRDELLGRPITALLPEARQQKGEDLLAVCLRGDDVRNVDWLRQAKDGTLKPVLLTLSLLTDEDEQPVAVAALAKDISDLKQTEEALRRSQEQLEQRVAERTAELERMNRELTHQMAEREQAEAELRLAKEQAEQANAAKSRFLAAASHDLRQPLQTMSLIRSTLTRIVEERGARPAAPPR